MNWNVAARVCVCVNECVPVSVPAVIPLSEGGPQQFKFKNKTKKKKNV